MQVGGELVQYPPAPQVAVAWPDRKKPESQTYVATEPNSVEEETYRDP